MNYMNYEPIDVVNGEGTRNVLFVSGCEHQCKGCFAQKSWNPNNGHLFTQELEDRIIADLQSDRIKLKGFTFGGGDPFFPANCEPVLRIAKRIKAECPGKDIWLWTGYVFEEFTEAQQVILEYIDVFVDGKFEQESHDPALYWRGSANQRLYRKNSDGVFIEDPKMWRDDYTAPSELPMGEHGIIL